MAVRRPAKRSCIGTGRASSNVVAEDPALELERLNAALASMYDALDVMLSDDRLESGSEAGRSWKPTA